MNVIIFSCLSFFFFFYEYDQEYFRDSLNQNFKMDNRYKNFKNRRMTIYKLKYKNDIHKSFVAVTYSYIHFSEKKTTVIFTAT